jgi:DNA polymerase-3 subunit delta
VQIDSAQLDRQLARELAPLYLIHGEETLLAIEAADRVRAAARRHGHTEREVLIVEQGFDWNRLADSAASLSLFAVRRLLDIRLPTASPGNDGADALVAHARRLPPDTVTLVSMPRLDRKARESRWFKALDAAGVAVQAQRVTPDALPRWLASRLEAQGHTAEPEALQFLAGRVEGNLLAARQEVEKLGLLVPPGRLSLDDVKAAVLDVARYDVFDLGLAVLEQQPERALRILESLRLEGAGPPLVLWALAEDIRVMLRVHGAGVRGVPQAQALREQRVWGDRQGAMQRCLRRTRPAALERALAHAARIDRIVKGVAPGNFWDEVQDLVLRVAAPEAALTAGEAR